MAKSTYVIAVLCAALGVAAAQAQTGTPDTGRSVMAPGARDPLHTRFLAPTGATVPRPGVLPAPISPSSRDRLSYDNDERIERSICSNC